MTTLRIILDGDGAFPEAKPERFGLATAIGRLPAGMQSGKSSVVIELTMPDGTKAYGQTSLAMLAMAVQAMQARDEADAAIAGGQAH
ncbi:MAG: hypothetical protein KF788_08745 [Piscinibacter sp.]|nr:hypothetical protein [Piscinibacter sp.]